MPSPVAQTCSSDPGAAELPTQQDEGEADAQGQRQEGPGPGFQCELGRRSELSRSAKQVFVCCWFGRWCGLKVYHFYIFRASVSSI